MRFSSGQLVNTAGVWTKLLTRLVSLALLVHTACSFSAQPCCTPVARAPTGRRHHGAPRLTHAPATERRPSRGGRAGTAALLRLAAFEPKAYEAEDIQVRRHIGDLGFVEVVDWEYYGAPRNPLDPATPTRSVEAKGTGARLFEGRLRSGERVLLKEHLPAARELGLNEMKMLKRLKVAYANRVAAGGEGADALAARGLPVANLLGFLLADESFQDRRFIEGWLTKMGTVDVPKPGNLWLVYQYEPSTTFNSFPEAKQVGEVFDLVSAEYKFRRRWRFVRQALRSSLGALAFAHGAGVIHRSLGAASLRLTVADDRYDKQLEVKLADFGFAQQFSGVDRDLIQRAKRYGCQDPADVVNFVTGEDLYALGYAFLELALGTLSVKTGEGPPPARDLTTLKRLVEDVYGGDLRGGFREYAAEEPAWAPAVALLDQDDGAGWEAAEYLVGFFRRAEAAGGRVGRGAFLSAEAMLGHRLFQGK